MLRHRRPLQAFLALGKRPELLFQGQVLLARFGRAAHTGEAMVFGGHRPIFGGIDHRVLPRGPVPPAAPEETAWDARTGPVGISFGTESLERFALAFRAGSVCAFTAIKSRETLCAYVRRRTSPGSTSPGSTPGDNPSSLCNKSLAQKVDARHKAGHDESMTDRSTTARRRRAADPCRPPAGPHCRSARDRPAGSPSPAARSCGSP